MTHRIWIRKCDFSEIFKENEVKIFGEEILSAEWNV
jgi:hypothetical protein